MLAIATVGIEPTLLPKYEIFSLKLSQEDSINLEEKFTI